MINRLLISLSTLLSLTLVLFVTWYPAQLMVGLLLLGLLPGLALLKTVWPNAHARPLDHLESLLVSIATSYALTTLLLMGLAFAQIPLTPWPVSTSLAILTLGLNGLAWYREHRSKTSPSTPYQPKRDTSRQQIGLLLLVLLSAAFFRLYRVHYSDYQGDEAGILLQAVSLYQGDVEAILTRFKGPGEVLILNAIAGLTDNLDELTARLPFSLAGTVTMGLVFLLGSRLFNPTVGFIAAMLGAVEGVYVSYARTAQYQNVQIMLSVAAIMCFYRYAQRSSQAARRLHGLGSFLLGVAVLFHFEALFLGPVALYLSKPLDSKKGWISHLMSLWPSVLIFGLMTASFYVPFLLHPSLDDTGQYLENRISSGDSPPFNNFDHFFRFEAFKYNSIYYVITFTTTLLTLALVQIRHGLANWLPSRYVKRSSWLTITIFLIVVGLSSGLTAAGQYQLSAAILALATAGLFAIVILSPTTSQASRALWLWVAPPAWVYLFLVNRPGKHHYTFWVALLLLIGLALWQTVQFARTKFGPAANRVAVGVGIAAWLIFASYMGLLMLRTELEYMLTYPENLSALYPTDPEFPYRTRIGFGYPYRLGWQVIGQLKRTGQLTGSWAANDEGNTLTWYLLADPPTPCYPDQIIQSEITFKGKGQVTSPFFPEEFSYAPRYQIWGHDRLRMTVLAFDPDGQYPEPIDLYESPAFAQSISPADFPPLNQTPPLPPPQFQLEPAPVLGEGSEIKQNAPAAYLERTQQLTGRVALIGYSLETQYDRIIPLNLYWHTVETVSLRYKIFVHLLDQTGQLWTQADDYPVCGLSHTNTWPNGSTVIDRHLLKLPPDLPNGPYQLRIGMYEPKLQLRLNYFDIAGNEQGNSFNVDNVQVDTP